MIGFDHPVAKFIHNQSVLGYRMNQLDHVSSLIAVLELRFHFRHQIVVWKILPQIGFLLSFMMCLKHHRPLPAFLH